MYGPHSIPLAYLLRPACFEYGSFGAQGSHAATRAGVDTFDIC